MAREIVSTKNICGGSPRIDGTRLTCGNIISILYFGKMPLDKFFTVYDYLTFDDNTQCLKYCLCKICIKKKVLKFCQNCILNEETEDEEIINEQEELWNISEELLNKLVGDKSQFSKVAELRKLTGLGAIYCLRALKEVEWNFSKAVRYLNDNPPVYLS